MFCKKSITSLTINLLRKVKEEKIERLIGPPTTIYCEAVKKKKETRAARTLVFVRTPRRKI